MTTKRAALLAAVGTTLGVASGLTSSFLSCVPLALHEDSSPFNYLRLMAPSFLITLVLGVALPLFFFLLHRSPPLLSIPSSLKKAAWAAAIASGLVAIRCVLLFGNNLLARADPAGGAAERMSHPVVWALLNTFYLVVAPSIALFGALTLTLFFMAVARGETGTQTVPLGLRGAAMYACVVAALTAAMVTVSTYFIFAISGNSYQKALLQGPSTFVWWNAILPAAITVCDQAALAAFFLTFFLKLPAPQSSQWLRLNSGE